jgi:hypothetical protein
MANSGIEEVRRATGNECRDDKPAASTETRQSRCRPCRGNTGRGVGPLATCELCRSHGGCVFQFRSTSTLPPSGQEDPELHVGRTKLYELMDAGLIDSTMIGGVRLMVGASKCRLFRQNMNTSQSGRGGYRPSLKPGRRARPEEAEPRPAPTNLLPRIPPAPSSVPSLVPPPPPVPPPQAPKP